MPRPRTALIAIFTLLLYSTTAISGDDEIYTSLFSNTGAGGYDVVAYFTGSGPAQGDAAFTTEYKGAEWQFSSQENLNRFMANPQRYTPQYGGYCAYAVANNYTASGDPLQWTVHNDKLYLNYNADVQARWTADRDHFITQGDLNWPGVLD
ncbi:MAG: YHS domain-containing protein [Gammaproteobacteria bacterium]|nr:YHS domain-containing protein [Gammaproteobacteria bacterium]